MFAAFDTLCNRFKEKVDFAQAVGKKDWDNATLVVAETDVLGKALLEMRDQLKLSTMRERRMYLLRQRSLYEGQEKERARISKDLHDGIGQLLTAMALKLEVSPVEASLKKEIQSSIGEILTEVRRISHDLAPSVLYNFGLEAAMKQLCLSYSQVSETKVEFHYVLSDEGTRIPRKYEEHIYRIAQEGLRNIIQHSKAKNSEIKLASDSEYILLEITDDGCGLLGNQHYQSRNQPHQGLWSIKERVQSIHGVFEINSNLGKGTCLKMRIPWREIHDVQ
jgi:signal transduction histidine kinase